MQNSKMIRFRTLGLSFLVVLMSFTAQAFAASSAVENVDRTYNTVLDQVEIYAVNPIQDLKQQALDHFGVAVNPYFKGEFDLTSNLFRTPFADKTDGIWTFTPGMSATYQTDYGRAGASYEVEFRYLSQFALQNEQNQAFSSFVDLFPTEEFHVHATESFNQVGALGAQRGREPVNYFENTTTVLVGRDWGKWGAEAGYEFYKRDFASDIHTLFNYHENKWNWGLYRQLTDEVRSYIKSNLGFIHYPRTVAGNDTTYIEFMPGIQGTLPGEIIAEANIGFHRRNLNSSFRNDFDTVTTAVILKRQFKTGTLAEVVFLRRPVESNFDGQTFYDEKYFYSGITQILSPRLRAKTGVSLANRDYEGASTVGAVVVHRDDDTIAFNLGLDYAAREWLIVHFGYDVEHRNSNISSYDYTENRLSVDMTMPL